MNSMYWIALTMTVALALIAATKSLCADETVTLSAAQETAAKEAIADLTRDPEATHFRQLKSRSQSRSGETIICGEMNGKNGFGGYIGYRPFWVTLTKEGKVSGALVANEESDIPQIQQMCATAGLLQPREPTEQSRTKTEKQPKNTKRIPADKVSPPELGRSKLLDNGPKASLSFAQYPAARYSGKTKLPQFEARDSTFRPFRTRIRDGLKEGPNFAGELSLIQFGCGTECSNVLVASNRTGHVFAFPRGGEANSPLQVMFRANSRLLISQWGDYDTDSCFREYFEWVGSTFHALGKEKIGVREICFNDIMAD
jgi:hypothetical protein